MKNQGPLVVKTAILTLAFGVLFVGQRPVEAQSQDGALVLHGCPDTITYQGRSVKDGQTYTYSVCADITFTPSGNVDATFHGSLVDPSTAPSHSVIVRDFPCQYNGGVTHDSEVVITPDGNVEGRCALHP